MSLFTLRNRNPITHHKEVNLFGSDGKMGDFSAFHDQEINGKENERKKM